jgi:hypothetical protein
MVVEGPVGEPPPQPPSKASAATSDVGGGQCLTAREISIGLAAHEEAEQPPA